MNDDITPPIDQELSERLRQAVDACRSAPSEAAVERVRIGGVRLGQRPRSAWRSRGLWLTGAAAAIVIWAIFWLAPSGTTWAQVAEKLKGQPWIHSKTPVVKDYWHEFWYSPGRDVYAWRDPSLMKFEDARLRVSYRYDLKDKTLVRLPQSERDRSQMDALRGTFMALMQNELPKDSPFPESEVVDKQRRRVKEGGQTWDEFEMTLKSIRTKEVARAVFRVDPETKLPVTLRLTPSERVEKQPESFVLSFDYPQTGPVDIYDLGVPRDAKIDDRVPTEDLERILAANRMGREKFDNYMAVVWQQPSTESEKAARAANIDIVNSHLFLLWRKGNRWRIESSNSWRPVRPVNADPGAWWMENYQKHPFIPVSVFDGTQVFTADRLGDQVKWKEGKRLRPGAGIDESMANALPQAYIPEWIAYPRFLVPSGVYRAVLSQAQKDGPTGSLSLQALPPADDPNALGAHYWLDPLRGYYAMQWGWTDGNAKNDAPKRRYILEKVDRSPLGYWYPLVMRHQAAAIVQGTGEVIDHVYRYHLDFKTDIPDRLFRPMERKAD
jgi:hypothetical protein